MPDFSLPLPLFASVHIADAICKRGDEFDVLVGLDRKYVEQLKELSLDESDSELQNNTGDYLRFGEGSYEAWYKKNRTVIALIHKQSDALAAIIWFGPKALGKKSIKFGKEEAGGGYEATWHTISVRAYPSFRGRGMMKNFVEFAIEVYKRHFINIKFWAGMDDRNHGVVRLLSELGFEIDEKNSDLPLNWLVMTKV